MIPWTTSLTLGVSLVPWKKSEADEEPGCETGNLLVVLHEEAKTNFLQLHWNDGKRFWFFVNKRWIFFFAEAAGGALFLVAFFFGLKKILMRCVDEEQWSLLNPNFEIQSYVNSLASPRPVDPNKHLGMPGTSAVSTSWCWFVHEDGDQFGWGAEKPCGEDHDGYGFGPRVMVFCWEQSEYPVPSQHFWVDDFPNFAWWDMCPFPGGYWDDHPS